MMNVKTRTIAVSALLACCCLHASAQEKSPPLRQAQGRPNVVFILADDLGWRDTAVYGSTFYDTPHIDALAKSGMRFTDAYSANCLCSPTRASILTGQYPVRYGLTDATGHMKTIQEYVERTEVSEEIRGAGPLGRNYLDSKVYTLGKAMKDAGYATGFFGKWHMGSRMEHWPESHGFEHVKGGRSHGVPPGRNGKRKYFPPFGCNTLPSDVPADTHVDDLIADLAIDYMEDQKQQDKPFFVCYWAYSVHGPFQSKPELIEKWKKKVDPKNPQHSPTMGAMIEVLDTNVGRLMKFLKENGLDENTIVIFTSDNGGNMYSTIDGTTPTSNAPLRNGKGNNYEGGVRIPLIVRWPGVTQPGSVNSSVVSTVDHYPAILEMTGHNPQPETHKDGVSYVPALKGEAFDRGPTICDKPRFSFVTMNIPNTSVRHGDWKLYRFWYDNPDGQSHRYELYNLKEDLGETQNLAKENPEKLKELADGLDAFYEESKALGYNPNRAYNRKSVGTWFATSDEGEIAEKEGALVIKSDQPGFGVANNVFSRGAWDGIIAFEARSETETPIRFAGKNGGTVVALTKEWKTFELKGPVVSLQRDKFKVSLEKAGEVEIRNAKVLTQDKSVMLEFRFY